VQLQLSVIVPLYNEEETVETLHSVLHDALGCLEISYELVFVDDGSVDRTFARAKDLAAKDPHLQVIRFRRNYGQTPAMAAGIDHARGEILVTMDGDLQNDPRDIPLLLAKIREGYDLVAGWRVNRQDKLISRKIPSKVANWLIGKVTGIPIRDNGCSLKAYRASIIKKVPLYSDMHRFIPAVSATVGARVAQVPVRHHARQFGESKYGLSRIFKVLLDLIAIRAMVGYAARPMAWFATMALPILAIVAGLTVAGLMHAEGPLLPIWGSVLILIVSVGFLIPLGMLAELLKRFSPLEFDLRAATTARLWHRRPDGRGLEEVSSDED